MICNRCMLIMIDQNTYKLYDQRHGGPFDRGSADSYYNRPKKPHYYVGDTGASPKVTELTKSELEAYNAGYDWNEQFGEKKDYR
jgi:hypothetical protein